MSLTPEILAKLDVYAAEHRWSRSMAVAVLVEHELEDPHEQSKQGQ